MVTLDSIYYEEGCAIGVLPTQGWSVDGVFCLNPDVATDRWDYMKSQFMGQSEDFPYVRIKGPRYEKSVLEHTLGPEGNDGNPRGIAGCAINTANCCLGHLRALNQAYTMGCNTAFILEDDMILNKNLQEELNACVKELNETDPEWIFCHFANPEHPDQTFAIKTRYSENLSNGYGMWGAGAILYSKRGLDIFKEYGKEGVQPYDLHTYHHPEGTYSWKLAHSRENQVVLYFPLREDGSEIKEFIYPSLRNDGFPGLVSEDMVSAFYEEYNGFDKS
tara:strand:- start:51 stop:878 length:828 start_codon:yes stop_codon:yes gene_type:complete